jgi:hypothetical protein
MTYDPSLGNAQSRVRLAVYDVDDAAALLPEATYVALLSLYDDSEPRATLAAAEALLMRYNAEPNKVEVTGAIKVEWAERLKMWAALVNRLRAELGLTPLGTADNTLRIGSLVRTTDTASEFGG